MKEIDFKKVPEYLVKAFDAEKSLQATNSGGVWLGIVENQRQMRLWLKLTNVAAYFGVFSMGLIYFGFFGVPAIMVKMGFDLQGSGLMGRIVAMLGLVGTVLFFVSSGIFASKFEKTKASVNEFLLWLRKLNPRSNKIVLDSLTEFALKIRMRMIVGDTLRLEESFDNLIKSSPKDVSRIVELGKLVLASQNSCHEIWDVAAKYKLPVESKKAVFELLE